MIQTEMGMCIVVNKIYRTTRKGGNLIGSS
jgi:hypothetical protein